LIESHLLLKKKKGLKRDFGVSDTFF